MTKITSTHDTHEKKRIKEKKANAPQTEEHVTPKCRMRANEYAKTQSQHRQQKRESPKKSEHLAFVLRVTRGTDK